MKGNYDTLWKKVLQDLKYYKEKPQTYALPECYNDKHHSIFFFVVLLPKNSKIIEPCMLFHWWSCQKSCLSPIICSLQGSYWKLREWGWKIPLFYQLLSFNAVGYAEASEIFWNCWQKWKVVAIFYCGEIHIRVFALVLIDSVFLLVVYPSDYHSVGIISGGKWRH